MNFENRRKPAIPIPRVTICVLAYGDYSEILRRVIESIRQNCPRSEYRLIVGANALGDESRTYLEALRDKNEIDHLIFSHENLNKCPMMRQMFAKVDTEFVWWFDDDSYITEPAAFRRWLRDAEGASERIVMWGRLAWCGHSSAFAPHLTDAVAFVRSADWYCGLPPPSWRPGGKGEFDFRGHGTGDGRWFFILGGCWLIRTSAIRALDWPDRRLIKMGDDVLLGEAIRQQGWTLSNLEGSGIAINTEARRGDGGARSRCGRMSPREARIGIHHAL
jgi:glycosyltransferase involved in cell wall biosynthesis